MPASTFGTPAIRDEAFNTWKRGTPLSEICIKYDIHRNDAYETFVRLAGGLSGFKALRAQGAGARGGGKSKPRTPKLPFPQVAQPGTFDPMSEDVVRRYAREEADEVISASRAQYRAEFSDNLRKLVMDEVRKHASSSELKVVINKETPVTVKHSHAMLKETLRRVAAGFGNLLCVGPAGSGKTTLAGQVATCLKRNFGFISLSGGTTEGALLGRMSSTGKYIPSLFVQIYENGGVFLLDEVDAADANVLLVLNSALANGDLAVPARADKPVAKRHKNTIVMCAANTWGTGADWQYVGRNQLDAAFLSRFAGAVLKVDYDEMLERALVTGTWYDEFVRVRHAASAAKLRRVMGTREMLAGDKLLKAGYTQEEVWHALTAGWTIDEVQRARIVA